MKVLQRVHPDGECLISDFSVGSHGYAQVTWWENGKGYATTAHRAAWVAYAGEQIPDGMTVDHTCRNRRCVRRVHLRLMSNESNGRMNAAAGHYEPAWSCHRNHPAERRRKRANGMTYCLDCNALAQARYRAKKVTA